MAGQLEKTSTSSKAINFFVAKNAQNAPIFKAVFSAFTKAMGLITDMQPARLRKLWTGFSAHVPVSMGTCLHAPQKFRP